jgi:hypothetical protein
MTDRKKVDIAIFECSEENEVENLRQVVICPPFQKVGKEGRHQDPRRRTRKDNQRLNADCDGVCDLVLRSDSKSSDLRSNDSVFVFSAERQQTIVSATQLDAS